MHAGLMDLLLAAHGVLTRRDLAAARVPTTAIDRAVAARELRRVLPSTYVLPELAADVETLRRAGLAYGGPTAALSHFSALQVWGLPVPDGEQEHVSVAPPVRRRTTGPVVVHRWRGLAEPATAPVYVRAGLRTVSLERAVVESWPLLRGDDRRAPAILGVQRRLTTPDRLRWALALAPKLPARAELGDLLGLLAAGCHSALELWGHLQVFTDPALPPSRGQVPVQIGRRTIYLDRYFDREMVDVELDGRKYHSSPAERERDIERDVSVSRQGVLVLRFSHQRITSDPRSVRDEIAAVLAVRRRQLRVA